VLELFSVGQQVKAENLHDVASTSRMDESLVSDCFSLSRYPWPGTDM
jgi:hypothetical protein